MTLGVERSTGVLRLTEEYLFVCVVGRFTSRFTTCLVEEFLFGVTSVRCVLLFRDIDVDILSPPDLLAGVKSSLPVSVLLF